MYLVLRSYEQVFLYVDSMVRARVTHDAKLYSNQSDEQSKCNV